LCRLAFELRHEGNQIPPPLEVVMRRLCDEPLPGVTVIAELPAQ